jgi:hypothetical protein
MRRTPIAIAAAVLLLAIAAVASAGPRDAELGRIAAEGPVTLSSNRPGAALLHAEHIKPGDRVTGLLSLSNKGDRAGDLRLGVTGKRDRPGARGGRLSRVLKLKVEDLSGKSPTRESVVERASTFALGRLGGRETRTYRVTATFPDGGRPVSQFAGDNLLQGSSVEVALQWQLTAASPARTAPPATPPASPGPTFQPANPPSGRRPLLVTLRVPKQRVLKPRGLKAYAECEIACKVRFTARTDNAPVKKQGKKKAKKRKTLMKKKVLKGERKWRKLRAGRERRVFLKMQPKARRKLKRRLHSHGRVGITIVVHMRSAAGNRTAKRRIVMRTYKKGERRR